MGGHRITILRFLKCYVVVLPFVVVVICCKRINDSNVCEKLCE
jgi:hypothetical protein